MLSLIHICPSYNEERRMSVHINKNGRTFIVECIIFWNSQMENISSVCLLYTSPIIFITAKDTENDTVTGFNLGADDYISKPFSLREVAARVKAVDVYKRQPFFTVNEHSKATSSAPVIHKWEV